MDTHYQMVFEDSPDSPILLTQDDLDRVLDFGIGNPMGQDQKTQLKTIGILTTENGSPIIYRGTVLGEEEASQLFSQGISAALRAMIEEGNQNTDGV